MVAAIYFGFIHQRGTITVTDYLRYCVMVYLNLNLKLNGNCYWFINHTNSHRLFEIVSRKVIYPFLIENYDNVIVNTYNASNSIFNAILQFYRSLPKNDISPNGNRNVDFLMGMHV